MAKKLSKMAKIWHNRVIDPESDKTFADVPLVWKADCKEYFRLDVENGVITPEQYEEYTGEPYEED